ncbi:hypothetical protein ACHWQZ_G012660 [Mnemiopsis leidyi]
MDFQNEVTKNQERALKSRQLSETFSSSIVILGGTAESAYHRIQHVQRTIVELGTMTGRMRSVTGNSTDTIQDLIYSDDIMRSLDEAEQALSRAAFQAKSANERLGQMKTEIDCRSERRGSSVVYRRGVQGSGDTLVVRAPRTGINNGGIDVDT